MKIGTREKNGIIIVDVQGNIDINSSELIETIGWLLIHRGKNIICNLGEVNLVDYIGVSVLAIIYKNVLNRKGVLRFYNIPGHIQKLFSLVGLDKVIESYNSEEEALKSFQDDQIIAKIMGKKLRRRFKRIPFRFNVEYSIYPFKENKSYRGKALNLSAIGLFVLGEKIFPEGQILFLRLNLLPEPGVIELQGKVVWESHENIHPLEYPAMGIEFYHIDSQVQKKILDFVEKHSG